MPSLPQQLQFQAPLPQPATMKLQAMDFQDKQRRTGLYERQIATSEETLKFNKMQKTLEMGKQFIPQLTKEEYPKFKKWVKSIGGPSELLPDEAPEDFEPFKEKLYYGADNITKSSIEQYKATMKQAEEKKKQQAATDLQTQKDNAAMARTKITSGEKETTEEKQKNKKLESLKSDYMQQVGRGYSAERGTGQFIPDENKAAVAKKAYDSAQIIAQTYVDAGGKWEDLGLEDPSKTPETKDMDFVTQLNESHPPAKFKGKTGTDTETGKKYKSDGNNWLEIK